MTGSRQWWDFGAVVVWVSHFWDVEARRCRHRVNDGTSVEVHICHGGATGADTMAGKVAALSRFPATVFEANWGLYRKAAGHIRNQQMLEEFKPDMGLAFLRADLPCRGTRDMMNRLFNAGIPTLVISGRAKERGNDPE